MSEQRGHVDPAATSVTLSETSARLSPRETHEFSYKISCAQMPCEISFLSSMIVGHTAQGLQIRVILDSAVYVCTKSKGCRAGIIAASGYAGSTVSAGK
jgi:hypothetical protein